MADNGLSWLTVGAIVAYISGRHGEQTVSEALVEKVGKRDVIATVNGHSQKFNINHTRSHVIAGGDRVDPVKWLHRASESRWNPGVDLAPWEHPAVVALRDVERRIDSRVDVCHWADEFRRFPDVETARKLRDAVDLYLKLHEGNES